MDFPARSQEKILSTIVHEYFHCWHGANFPGAIEGYRDPRVGSSRVSPRGSRRRHRARGPDPPGRSTSSTPGSAGSTAARIYVIGFYWQLNHLDGRRRCLLGPDSHIIASGEPVPSYRAATAGSLGTCSSPSWIVRYPKISSGVTSGPSTTLASAAAPGRCNSARCEGLPTSSARATEQVAIEFDFTDGDERPRLIELIYEGLTVSAWHQQPDSTTTTGPVKTTWCLNPECVCEDGEPIPDAIPVPGNDARIIVALTGGGREQASIEARVASMDDACEDEVDPELTGVWIADPAALVAAYDQAYQQIGISVTGAAGELALTLFPDGRAELRYQEVRLGLSDPFVDEAIINGVGTLGWQVLDGQLIFSELSDLTVSIVTPAFSDVPITFTERRFPTATTSAPKRRWTAARRRLIAEHVGRGRLTRDASRSDRPACSCSRLPATRAGDAPGGG